MGGRGKGEPLKARQVTQLRRTEETIGLSLGVQAYCLYNVIVCVVEQCLYL